MQKNQLAQKIRTLRIRKGYSQEDVAEKTGLSLRTIQRVENGETEPRGDSLKRLAVAFELAPEDIVDWKVQEDRGLLAVLNLSALGFLVFPLLGLAVPLMIWLSKKDKVSGINKVAKSLLNFQITLILIWLVTLCVIARSVELTVGFPLSILTAVGLIALYNIVFIVVNAIRSYQGKDVKYFPKIRFIPN